MTDAAKLPLMLGALRLPTIGRLWQEFAGQADREGWGAARFLVTLCEHELAERTARRIARHLAQSDLPAGKTLTSFDFAATPSLRKAHLAALAAGDAWQFERSLTQERVRAGLAAARRRGRRGGRPVAIDFRKDGGGRPALEGGATKAADCRTFGIKRSTLMNSLTRIDWPAGAKPQGNQNDAPAAIDRDPDHRVVRAAGRSSASWFAITR